MGIWFGPSYHSARYNTISIHASIHARTYDSCMLNKIINTEDHAWMGRVAKKNKNTEDHAKINLNVLTLETVDCAFWSLFASRASIQHPHLNWPLELETRIQRCRPIEYHGQITDKIEKTKRSGGTYGNEKEEDKTRV